MQSLQSVKSVSREYFLAQTRLTNTNAKNAIIYMTLIVRFSPMVGLVPSGLTMAITTGKGSPTTGSCGRRRQRAIFPDTFVAGAAHPERWASYAAR